MALTVLSLPREADLTGLCFGFPTRCTAVAVTLPRTGRHRPAYRIVESMGQEISGEYE